MYIWTRWAQESLFLHKSSITQNIYYVLRWWKCSSAQHDWENETKCFWRKRHQCLCQASTSSDKCWTLGNAFPDQWPCFLRTPCLAQPQHIANCSNPLLFVSPTLILEPLQEKDLMMLSSLYRSLPGQSRNSTTADQMSEQINILFLQFIFHI